MSIITNGCTEFQTRRNKTYQFVRFVKPDHLLVWEEVRIRDEVCQGINVRDVNVDVLIELEIWDQLTKATKEAVNQSTEDFNNRVGTRMEKARKGRRKKYPHFPKEMTCITCKDVIKVVPSVLAGKLEKQDITLEKYIEGFECTKCKPVKRGRQADPKNAPQDLVCKCGNKVTYPLNHIKKTAEKKGKTVEEFIKDFYCQSCRPTIGKWRKNKK